MRGDEQPAFGERVEIAPDRFARHVEFAYEFGDRQCAGTAKLFEDPLLSLFRKHVRGAER